MHVRRWREHRVDDEHDAIAEMSQQPPGKMKIPPQLDITTMPPREVRAIFDGAVRRMEADVAASS
eukprot:gene12092-2220_t